MFPDSWGGLGERSEVVADERLCVFIACGPDDDLGRASLWRWPQGVVGACVMFSLIVSPGATKEDRSPKAALLRFEVGALPVCCVYSAFFFAIAAAASGNMAFIVEGSSPELRLLPGDGGGRPSEFRELSTLSLLIASLRRFDIASGST